MASKISSGTWRVMSVVFGIACVPFVVIWFWHNLTVIHEPLHPIPPDHVVPLGVGHGGDQIVYVTPLENKFWSPWVVIPGVIPFLGFVITFSAATGTRTRALARVQMIAKKDGGLLGPIASRHRLSCTFHTIAGLVSYMGRFELEVNRLLYPGDNAEIIVSFPSGKATDELIQVGRKWTIHEGGRLVGYGEVITLLSDAAFDASTSY